MRRWFSGRPYTRAELENLYDDARWGFAPVALPLGSGTLVHLRYCRVIGSVVSYLDVVHADTGDGVTVDEAAGGDPFEVRVHITAYAAERSCPAALGQEARRSGHS